MIYDWLNRKSLIIDHKSLRVADVLTMTTRRLILAIFVAGAMILIGFAVLHFLPRHYYRYAGGTVYLVDNPNTVWNGLRGQGPLLQFEVPLFAHADLWNPSPEQIRRELVKSNPDLSEEQISRIIQCCVPCGAP